MAKSPPPRVVSVSPDGSSLTAEFDLADGGLVEVGFVRDPIPDNYTELCTGDGRNVRDLPDDEQSLLGASLRQMIEAVDRRAVWRESIKARYLAREPAEVASFARRALDSYLTSSRARAERLRLAGIQLDEDKSNPTPAAHAAFTSTIGASDLLEQAIAKHLGELIAQIDKLEAGTIERDGMMAWDAILAAHAESLGDEGRRFAKAIRENAPKRWAARNEMPPANLWHLWLVSESDEGSPPVQPSAHEAAGLAVMLTHAERERLARILVSESDVDRLNEGRVVSAPDAVRQLTQVLWRDLVGHDLERAHRKPAALVMAVAEPVAHLFSRARREEEHDGQRALRLPGEVLVRVSQSAATIGTDTINALMVNKGVKLFGSVASHRLLRWQIFTAHRQALEGNPDPRVVRVDGGYSTLAHDVLGMSGKKAAEQVRDIIEAMHATELPLPPHGNYSRLLIREAHTPRGRGKQWIKLVLGTALLPDYVKELQDSMGKSLEARRATRLVPVLEIPPLIGKASGGRDNEMGAQATFSMLLVAFLRDNARELIEAGGVKLSKDRLHELARAAKLPEDMAQKLLEHWQRDHFDGPAFLSRVAPNVYTLGNAHAKERTFIEEGGRRELHGQAGGEKANRKRLAQLRRRGKA